MDRSAPLRFLVAAFFVMAGCSSTEPRPTSPDAPGLEDGAPVVFCGNCDRLFDLESHKAILERLASNAYVAQLRRALYTQDLLHQFESRAHYDNCDFDNSADYIDSLLADVGGHVLAAQKARDDGNRRGAEDAAKSAFFSLGQALHAVQDFYAHTNYVELSVDHVSSSGAIPIIAPWTSDGKDRILDLRTKGLISGYVFWGFPQHCPNGTPSHGDLAKDTATTTSGAVRVTHLKNQSRHEIAVELARKASAQLVDHAFVRWPLLKELNGRYLAFEVLVDQRGGEF